MDLWKEERRRERREEGRKRSSSPDRLRQPPGKIESQIELDQLKQIFTSTHSVYSSRETLRTHHDLLPINLLWEPLCQLEIRLLPLARHVWSDRSEMSKLNMSVGGWIRRPFQSGRRRNSRAESALGTRGVVGSRRRKGGGGRRGRDGEGTSSLGGGSEERWERGWWREG